MLEEYGKRWSGQLYFVFRVLVGLMFFLHGVQKMFGANPASFGSLIWVAGVVELVGGLLVALGLLTRWAALVSGVQMIVAYVMVHASQGWNPLVNQGELALMYLAAFLVMVAWGGGSWSLDEALWKK